MIFHYFSTFFISIIVFLLGLGVLLKNRNNSTNRSFFILCFSTAVWLFFYSLGCSTNSTQKAEFYLRICYLGIVNIWSSVFHFTVNFLNLKNLKKSLFFTYNLTIVCAFLVITTNYLVKGIYFYPWGYYLKAGILHPIFLLIFITTISICFLLLIKNYLETDRLLRKTQIKYIIIAFIFFSMALVDFAGNYGIRLYPIGYISTTIFLGIIAYSIIKYRLLNISIIITRTGIFIGLYSFILGIPFAIAFGWREKLIELIGELWWVVPLVTSTVLATGGPFIYLFIQRKAEARLLKEQKRYQSTLRQASAGMSRIKDLKRLLSLIVYVLCRAVNLKYCFMYLYDGHDREYSLEAVRGKKREERNSFIAENSPLIKYLIKIGAPVVYEEVKQKMHDFGDGHLKEVELGLRELEAEVVIPIATDKNLIAFGVLGKKKSGKMYTSDDLAVFAILGNQVALAIENAQFYEESKKTQAQLFQAEKMATIGTMADGLSHQINNRLHALGFIAGDALDSIKLKGKQAKGSPEEIKDLLQDITSALLKIQDNVRQGGEIVQGLLRYTRKGEEGFGPVDFDKLINASVEMAQFKIKKDQLSIIKDYPKNIPSIYGNFTQLQEVMFNVIDNSYDAIQQRKAEVKDSNYKGKIKVSTRQADGFLEINFLDNGIGVKDEDQSKLFTPFFTTKLSSKKGTGLGLYVMRKIIEENHHGRVFMSSEYMVGTLTVIKVPIAKNN